MRINGRGTDANECIACDLIDAIVLDEGGLVALAQVFIDESGTHDRSPCMAIGGLVFKKHKATEFSRRWRAILKGRRVPYFRMADVTHPQQGPFKDWSPADLLELEKKLIALLGRYAEHGFAVSLNEDDFIETMSEELWEMSSESLIGHAYTYCLRRALTSVGSWVGQSRFEGKISYFFEAGHKHQSNAHDIISKAYGKAYLQPRFGLPPIYDYKYAAHAFVQKGDFPPIQGADLIAWLWRNSSMKLLKGKPERQDMTALREALSLETVHLNRSDLQRQNALFSSLISAVKDAVESRQEGKS